MPHLARRLRLVAVVSLSGLALALPAAAQTAISAVTLSTAGLAMIEAQGRLGERPLSFSVMRDDVDDVLKSLWVLDPAGGVPVLTLSGPGGFEDAFAPLPFDPQALADRARLLASMAGAPVRIERRGENWMGTIMGVSQRPCDDGQCPVLSLHGDDGQMLAFDLDIALSVSFTDPADQDAVAAGLAALRASAGGRRVDIALSSSDPAPRDIGLIYLQEVPLWRTAWRAVTDGDDLRLTGWAVVENTTGLDWDGVTLTLATGAVRAIDADLYSRRYAGREAGLFQIPAEPAPMVADAILGRSMPMAEAAPQVAVAVQADDGESFSRFTLSTPVTLPAGQMLSLPFLSESLPQASLRLFRGGRGARHPALALEIENPLPLRLPAGVVTIYDGARGHAGDATIPELAPGARETVIYAQDSAIEIREETGQTETLRELRLAGGVLTVTEDLERRHIYRMTGAPGVDRVITIDHPRSPGWSVSAATGPQELPDAWRWQVDLPADATTAWEVRERQPRQRRIALVDMDLDALAYWQSRSRDVAVSDTLARLIDLRRQIASAEALERQLLTQAQGLEREQARLVNLIVQLGDDSQANRDRRARVDVIDAEIAQAQADARAAAETARRLRDQAAALIRG